MRRVVGLLGNSEWLTHHLLWGLSLFLLPLALWLIKQPYSLLRLLDNLLKNFIFQLKSIITLLNHTPTRGLLICLTLAISSSNSSLAFPFKLSKSIQPTHFTHTPFMIKGEIRCTYTCEGVCACVRMHVTYTYMCTCICMCIGMCTSVGTHTGVIRAATTMSTTLRSYSH